MGNIAFINRTSPHGCSAGRESLDAILATSALTDELSIYFIGDGVYQLLTGQQPEHIGCRNYAKTFAMLELYDIEDVFVCRESLQERGLMTAELLIDVNILSQQEIRQRLQTHSAIINY